MFYASLGLEVAARSLNTGPEQARLDGIDGATVDVVSLALPSRTAPHVELLAYRGAFDRAAWPPGASDDVVSTVIVFAGDDRSASVSAGAASSVLLHDPDGHRLAIGR